MTVVFTLPTFKELKSGTKLCGVGSSVNDDPARRVVAQVHHHLQTTIIDLDETTYNQLTEQIINVIKSTDTADPLGVELQGVFLLGQLAYRRHQFEEASAHASWCLETAENHGVFQAIADVSAFLVAVELAHQTQHADDAPELSEITAFATATIARLEGRADTFDLEWQLLQTTAFNQESDIWGLLVEQAQQAPTEAQRAKALSEVLPILSETAKIGQIMDVCNAAIAAARHDLETQRQISENNAEIAAAQLVAVCDMVTTIAATKGSSLKDEHYNRLLNILQLQLENYLQYFAKLPDDRLRCLARFHAQKARLSIVTKRFKAGQKNLRRSANLYRNTNDQQLVAQLYLDVAQDMKKQGEVQLTKEFACQALAELQPNKSVADSAKELVAWADRNMTKHKK